MRRILLGAFLGLLLPGSLAAQSTANPAAGGQSERPVANAVPRSGAVELDGRLDDAAWSAAPVVGGFTQQKPVEGAPAAEKTEVRFLYDDEAIYVGARMYDSRGAAGVTRRLTRRDESAEADVLRVDFDPYGDRLHSVEFDVNPAGWRGDATDTDRSWDPVWQAAARVDSLGWTAEIRIPFSQLRFSRDSVQTWGLNLTRVVHRTQERSQWAFWRQNEPGGPAFFGTLAGLRIHRRPAHAELLPYAVTRSQRLSSSDPRSPFYDPHRSDLRIGADLKYLLTSSFTLSATVNPDFGQVEVDPAVVNLSAFETFFPERRPFFVEGGSVFDFGSPGCNINCGLGLALFYSRRIGRSPQGAGLAYGAGDFADVPENTRILGAAKMTGRTRRGLSVGLLDAVTRREVANVAGEDGTFRQAVEPLANSVVGRVKQELRGGNLVVGAIATAVDRKLDDDGLAALLPRTARAGGVDAEAFWGQHTYRLYAALTASRETGDPAAIARLQRSSARYFQRPDRGLSDGYDPTSTSLGGYGAIARLTKDGGSWIWDLNAATISPGFETNDLGYLQQADWRWVNGTFGRQLTRPTRWYRNLTAMVGAEHQWNYDGDDTGADVSAFVSTQLLNYWSFSLFGGHTFAALNDRLTRGGPVVGQAGSTSLSLNASGDPRRRVVLGSHVGMARGEDGGHEGGASVSATLRPAPNVRLSLGPGYSRYVATDQYVTSVADPTATAFFGRRYVFAHIDQRQLYMNTRASVTFTPLLSLDLYAQPLLASGDYSRLQEFAAPRTREKLVYGRDVGTVQRVVDADGNARYVVDPDGAGAAASFSVGDPDFNFRSLRGTGVLRWEWRPGSTAYLAWTQTRSGVASVGDLDFGRDRRALFAEQPDNIFVLKVSYWIGV
jgi:hypothetical protein